MDQQYILSCESTVDLPFSYVNSRNIPVLFYTYTVNGKEYEDDMGRDPDALPEFYRTLQKEIPNTSQINIDRYIKFFESLLEKGDVLHVAFGSGMSNSVNNAMQARDILLEKYPGRRLEVIDSYCSSSGYGLFVDGAADLRDEGKSLDEVKDWLLANCRNVHHQFYSTDLKYFRRSGRMSGPAATLGAVLNICPIMRLDRDGCIKAYDKVRGRKAALERTLNEMEAHADGGTDYAGKCFINHSNCLAEAEKAAAAVRERFPHIKEVRICDIGTIIASHCGPGTLVLYFFGDERPEME